METRYSLRAYEPTALFELVPKLRDAQATDQFDELAAEIARRENVLPTSMRAGAARPVLRPVEHTLPEVRIDDERLMTDPRTFALEQIAMLPTTGDGLIESSYRRENIQAAVIEMCLARRLSVLAYHAYDDLAWWAGRLDQRWYPEDDPEWNEAYRAADRAAWQASALRVALEGSMILTFDREVFLSLAYPRARCWHDRAGIELAVREFEALRDRDAPPLATFPRSATCEYERSFCVDHPGPRYPELYADHVVEIRDLIDSALDFYRECLQRGWIVHVAPHYGPQDSDPE